MDTLTSNEVGRILFTLGSAIFLLILWLGYYRNIFIGWFSFTTLELFVVYVGVFLMYRYVMNHMADHIAHDLSYAHIALLYGTFSLITFSVTTAVFLKSQRLFGEGRNYFRENKTITLSLAILLPLTLMSGLLI